MSASVHASSGLSTNYNVFPAQQPSVVEAPVNNFEPTVYSGNDVVYQDWDSSEAHGYSSDTGMFGGDGIKTIGIALGGIVPVVIVIVVIVIIIAIVVELRGVNTNFKLEKARGNPAPSWLDSIVSSFNDVESERLLNRMFPGGFHDIIDNIEGFYRRYRGLTKEN